MNLAELINLEYQLLKDSDINPVALRKRDRKIGQELAIQNLSRGELFLAWLKRVQTFNHYSPGHLLETEHRWFGFFLLILGLMMGGATAASVLSYNGSSPVNIVHFLAVIIGVQLIMIILFVLNLLPISIKKFIPGSGDFYNFIRELSYLFSRLTAKIFSHLQTVQLTKLWFDLKQLKIRQKLYGSVEKWFVIGLTQRFSLAFNLGALAACLYLISFSDLAFAWNTTLQISTESFHKIVHIIAIPWSCLFPDVVPSLELVEASRYFRLNAEYLQSPTYTNLPQVVGGWWKFLILSLIFYGLLPRIIILSFAKLKLKRVLTKLPLKSADFESLYDRLTHPLFETQAIKQQEPISEVALSDSKMTLKFKNKSCTVIKWADLEIPENELAQLLNFRFGWKIKDKLTAGSLDYHSSDATTYKFIKDQKAQNPILILAESWEPPTAMIHFLKKLRKTTSVDRQIIIGLINSDSKKKWQPPLLLDLSSWKNELAALADPYLRVESMVEEA